MKRTIFLALILACFANTFAQEKDNQRKNDFLLDPLTGILTPALNVSYEHLFNEDMGAGINVLVDLSSDVEKFNQFSPFYRLYFGRKYASGFFAEAFIPITTTIDTSYNYENFDPFLSYPAQNIETKNTTVGLGFGIGGKWVTRKNIVLEVSAGAGRRFSSKSREELNNTSFDEIVPKGLLGIGYRF